MSTNFRVWKWDFNFWVRPETGNEKSWMFIRNGGIKVSQRK